MDERACSLRDYPKQVQSTCHCGFKEQNRYVAGLSLHLHINGDMAEEISERRATRALAERVTQSMSSRGLTLVHICVLGLGHGCKVSTGLQCDEKNTAW